MAASNEWSIFTFRWNFKYSWNRRCVCVNDMTNEFSAVLVDQNNVDVITTNKTLEAVLDFANGCVWKLEINFVKIQRAKLFLKELTLINNHEVCMTILIDFTYSTEQEANASVLKVMKIFVKYYFKSVYVSRYFTSSPMIDKSFPLIAEWRAIVDLADYPIWVGL